MDTNYKLKTLAIGMTLMDQPQSGLYLCEELAISKQKDDGPQSVDAMFKRCESIVTFFNSCGVAEKALSAEQTSQGKKSYKLIRSTDTRWNSRLVLGMRILKLADEIKTVVDSLADSIVATDAKRAKAIKPSLLSPEERLEFTRICEMLKPAASLTHRIGASKCPTISTYYAEIYNIFSTPVLHTSEATKSLQKDLKSQIMLRFPYTDIPNAALIAMYLNPGYFNSGLFKTEPQYLSAAKDLTQKALLHLARDVDTQKILNTQEPTAIPFHTSTVAGGALAKLRSTTHVSMAHSEMVRYSELVSSDPSGLVCYLKTPEQFWKEVAVDLPLLSRLFCAYHCAQSTSSESERLFSKAEQLLPVKKVNLSYTDFYNMLMHSSYERFKDSYKVSERSKKVRDSETVKKTDAVKDSETVQEYEVFRDSEDSEIDEGYDVFGDSEDSE
ncbi:hypothetical protein FBU30_001819 [Linnemannia zychae]|nr:hypothetical protein FBU30_001819 [Linnemannia zychae]